MKSNAKFFFWYLFLFSLISSQLLQPAYADDTINVQAFGAKGDGTTDDTAAIKNAANAVLSSFNITKTPAGATLGRANQLYFPKGNYLISSAINIQTPMINIRSDSGATITQTTESPIFVISHPSGGGSVKVNVSGLQFIGGTNQIIFSNDNVNGTMLKIENCEFRESSDYAVRAIGVSGDLHLSAILTIENSKFFGGAGVLQNYADAAIISNTWVQAGGAKLQANSSLFYNGSGELKFESMFAVPEITQAQPRVPGVSWVKLVGGHLMVNRSRFGGEGAGYPIVNFAWNGVLEGGSTGSANTYPYMGSSIIIENSMVCSGSKQAPDSGIIVVTKRLPHLIRLVGNHCLIDAPYIRLMDQAGAQAYINTNSAPKNIFKFTFEPNLTWNATAIPSILTPYVK